MSQNHPQGAYFGPWRVKRSHQRLDCNFGTRTLPIGSKGRRCDRREGIASAFKPRLRLRQGPPSGMVLLMVADVLWLSQVTHAGLATNAFGPVHKSLHTTCLKITHRVLCLIEPTPTLYSAPYPSTTLYSCTHNRPLPVHCMQRV